jgi:hypothetical protein
MSARYVAQGNSYAAKGILKCHGFYWWPQKKFWFRTDGTFDICGDNAEQSVQKARAEIKEAGIDCEIVYVAEDTFVPSA